MLTKESREERSKRNDRNQIVLWESLASVLRDGLLVSFTPLFPAK
jgi:hypothetical protein